MAAGAVIDDTIVTVTEAGPPREDGPSVSAKVLAIHARPSGQQFNAPVSITLNWEDRDDDGNVDTGRCGGRR